MKGRPWDIVINMTEKMQRENFFQDSTKKTIRYKEIYD